VWVRVSDPDRSSAARLLQIELSPNSDGLWKERVLYAFVGQSDGSNPNASLIFDVNGHLYGTTFLSA